MGKSYPRARHQGLTAFELLIGLAVATILLITAVPGLGRYIRDKRLDAAVTHVHSGLNQARRAAVTGSASIVVCPGTRESGCLDSADWHQGWLIFADLNRDREWQNNEPVLRVGTPLDRLTAKGAPTRNRLRFSPAGAAPASNATIIFCDDRGLEHGRKLVLSNTGRLRRADLEASDADRCRA